MPGAHFTVFSVLTHTSSLRSTILEMSRVHVRRTSLRGPLWHIQVQKRRHGLRCQRHRKEDWQPSRPVGTAQRVRRPCRARLTLARLRPGTNITAIPRQAFEQASRSLLERWEGSWAISHKSDSHKVMAWAWGQKSRNTFFFFEGTDL